ncbi:four-carbon acid sugar kinase family protein [Mucilaginibacter sp. HMF5004]|uniref:four-carbon acid sugar kinase family protein n=1 Tax=Mucilaginibacter rivuli TaxID=2857527 RepID=UPI001C601589|nr:four-carbon acid sugar kinase family protein [Mucilaginibacter rivuli]MBW4888995.1 four-carbon acid sugar kinase family protein [Mucilaginibacter rivuli]
MMNKQNLLLAYYGDDFTGSTDALEFLSRAGIKTVLFIDAPTPGQLSRYQGLQAIGVAGMTRAMPPAEMEAELLPAFEAVKQLGAPHVHYKVCSTFDSSPTIGSIGKAADVGASVFNAPFIPLLVAAPALGRYCAFGNLFARMGIGSTGEIFRLDRHPSMSKHPVTPADESDLRLHLSKQTTKTTGLVDVADLEKGADVAQAKLQSEIAKGNSVVLFDGLNDGHLLITAKLIDTYADSDKPLFSIGSSGIEMAMGSLWQEQGIAQPKANWPHPGKAKSMLVISGSCSPVTAKQIAYAAEHDFAEIKLDTHAVAVSADINTTVAPYIQLISELMQRGIPVILHTSLGTADPRFANTYQIFSQQGLSQNDIRTKTAQLYGTALGMIALGVAAKSNLQRLIIAGGDTSGFAARALGIEAVEMIAPLSPGAPLCKAYAPGSAADGIELNFKGGQVGAENYFEMVLNG